jgi:hypothetical protein
VSEIGLRDNTDCSYVISRHSFSIATAETFMQSSEKFGSFCWTVGNEAQGMDVDAREMALIKARMAEFSFRYFRKDGALFP